MKPIRIDPEDFEVWLANPITRQLMGALAVWEDQAKEAWVQLSWDMSQPDLTRLAALKGRAEVLRQLRDLSKDQLEDPAREQPEDQQDSDREHVRP